MGDHVCMRASSRAHVLGVRIDFVYKYLMTCALPKTRRFRLKSYPTRPVLGSIEHCFPMLARSISMCVCA